MRPSKSQISRFRRALAETCSNWLRKNWDGFEEIGAVLAHGNWGMRSQKGDISLSSHCDVKRILLK